MNVHQHSTDSEASGSDTLRALRRAAGLSQERLGAMAGLSFKTIRRAEVGSHCPSPDSLRRIAAVLGVDPEDLGFPLVTAAEYGRRAWP